MLSLIEKINDITPEPPDCAASGVVFCHTQNDIKYSTAKIIGVENQFFIGYNSLIIKRVKPLKNRKES